MGKFDSIFTMTVEQILQSDYRFRINRPRSVVTIDGSEFDETLKPGQVGVYAMYNADTQKPIVVSIEDNTGAPLVLSEHEKFLISYVAEDKSAVTYVRRSVADAILSADDE